MIKILKSNLIAVLKLRAVRINLLLLIMGCFSLIVSAQSTTVTGIVKDATGEPLIGVSIQLKENTKIGTITDIDGKFTLSAPANSSLMFSYIGYERQTIQVQSNMVVTMQPDSRNLDEVVVVGYGTQKKASLTGAITQVKGDEILRDKPSTSVALALQGEVPGLTITRSSSRPGNEGTSIKLRGDISINSVDPMVLIDGVDAYLWELQQMNPNDVESISVLKDGSAAIYGTRAAGGVILVTTKRGKEGKLKVSYSGALHTNFIGNRFPVANMSQWAKMNLEASRNDAVSYIDAKGVTQTTNPSYWMFTEDQYNKMANSESFTETVNGKLHRIAPVDQFDAVYGTTVSQSHNLNVSGGNEKATFMTSLGYANDRSVIDFVYDGMKKYNFRTNLDYKVSDLIKTNFNISYDQRVTSTPTQGVGQGVQDFYIFPLYNPQGQYYDIFGFNNMLAKLDEGGRTTSTEDIFRLGGKITLDLNKYIKGLSFNANANIRQRFGSNVSRSTTVTMYDWDGGISSQTKLADTNVKNTTNNSLYQTYGAFGNYTNAFGKHTINLTAGVTSELTQNNTVYAYRKSMLSDLLDDLNTGDKTTQENSGGSNAIGLVSLIGRFNYDYAGTYLLELLGRRDGSSKLQSDYRWKNFGGASAGIRLSEIGIIKDLSVFDNLKLRGSYGETGSMSGIGNYDYISAINTGTAVFGNAGTLATSAWIAAMTSKDRSWERVSTLNYGLDYGFLGNRLNGSFDYFIRKNTDMLISVTYPQLLGANAPTTNSGNFQTKGWELALKWDDKIGEVKYNMGVSLSDANSLVTSYPGRNAIVIGKNTAIEGKPLNALYVYKTEGYLQTEADVTAYYAKYGKDMTNNKLPVYSSASRLIPGCVNRVDLNDDGKINTSDLYYYGDANPHFTYGINLGLSWKNFDFNAFFQGVGQQNIIRTGSLSNPFNAGWTNQNSTFLGQTWSAENTNADFPIMSRDGTRNAWNYKEFNDINVQNVSYCRAKNISLGYTFSSLLMKKISVDRLRVYVAGADLFEISNIKDGFDPENGDASGQGNTVPFSRAVSVGLDITF